MLVGLFEFSEVLIAITVVGISCKDAVFTSISIAIELLRVFLFEFSFCIVSIAFSPSGVDAFPSPSMFAIIFRDISSYALSCFFISGNINFMSGDRYFASFFEREESFAICIIPHQSVIVPKNVIVSSVADSADSKIPLFIFSKLPENRAYIYEITIKIGHNTFNIILLS